MNVNGGFISMVKSAVDYTNRTGIDGLNLSPLQLEIRSRMLREQLRAERLDMAEAVAVAMSGKEEAWEHLKQ